MCVVPTPRPGMCQRPYLKNPKQLCLSFNCPVSLTLVGTVRTLCAHASGPTTTVLFLFVSVVSASNPFLLP